MSANSKRKKILKRIETEIRTQVEQFWQQFNMKDLEELDHSNSEAWARFEALGGYEMIELEYSILTPEEHAKLKRIEKELREEGHPLFLDDQHPELDQLKGNPKRKAK